MLVLADAVGASDSPAKGRLGHWLRMKRYATSPEAVGANPVLRSRVSRLTQSDVAHLAGINRRTYQEVELGVGEPTAETLDRIAKALRLTNAEVTHVRHLANPALQRPTLTNDPQELAAVLAPITTAAFAYDATLTVLAHNDQFADLVPGVVGVERLNFAEWLFIAPHSKRFMVDWHDVAQNVMRLLRAARARYADTSAFDSLLDHLCRADPVARQLWDHDATVIHEPLLTSYRIHDDFGRIRVVTLVTLGLVGELEGLRLAYLLPESG